MKKTIKAVKNLFYLSRPFLRHAKFAIFYIVFNALVLVPAIAFASINIPKTVIDGVTGGASFGSVARSAALWLGIYTGAVILRGVYNSVYDDIMRQRLTIAVRREIFERAVKTEFKYFDNPEFYRNYTVAIEEYTKNMFGSMNQLSAFMGAVTQVTAMTAYIAALGLPAVALSFAAFALTAFVRVRMNRTTMSRYEEQLDPQRRMTYVQRVFYSPQNAADIKSNDTQRLLLGMYDNAGAEVTRIFHRFAPKITVLNAVRLLLPNVNEYAAILYMTHGILSGGISGAGAYAAFVAASAQLNNSMMRLFDFAGELNMLSLYAEKIRAFFSLESTIETPQAIAEPVPSGAFAVEIANVSFSYTHSGFALKNININIKPRAKIAIVGENGAGKSTLSKLILRLYEPDTGSVLINGKPLRQYDVQQLRRRIGTAFQQTNIYALTARENLCAYNAVDDGILNEVLKSVGLEISPGSEMTREFSPDGIVLSGGEAQKLGLARLLHGDYGLLLLDEPSSALDPIAEYELTRLMFGKTNTTTIMVAHRLSTIRDADCIYLVSSGEIAEQGTHAELMNLGGKYAEMFKMQAEKYIT